MTWASFFTRSAGLLVVLPMILRRFNAQEMAVYLLFSAIMNLRAFADFGFGFTFIRYLSSSLGGARSITDIAAGVVATESRSPNLDLFAEVVGTMRQYYRWMTGVVVVALLVGGSLAVRTQLSALADPGKGWAAWAVVLAGTTFTFWANGFSSYLQGLNQVALLRRWEALFSVLAIVSVGAVLLAGGGLLAVIVTNQIWNVLSGIRNWILSRQAMDGWWRREAPRVGRRETLLGIWSPAWRTGIGVGMSMGLLQLTGVFYAQWSDGPQLAALLLALRLMAIVVEFSVAPFYSKIPLYSRLYAGGDLKRLVAVTSRGMRLAYASFLAGWIGLGLFGPEAFNLIRARTEFPPENLWSLLGLAFLLHRFGAMHIQFACAGNRVVNHIADGVAGLVYLLVLALTHRQFGPVAVPIAQIAAYAGFYSWFAARNSYQVVPRSFWHQERTAFIPAASVALVYALWGILR